MRERKVPQLECTRKIEIIGKSYAIAIDLQVGQHKEPGSAGGMSTTLGKPPGFFIL